MLVSDALAEFLAGQNRKIHGILSFVLGDWVDNKIANGVLDPPPLDTAHLQHATPTSFPSGQATKLWAFQVVCSKVEEWMEDFPKQLQPDGFICLRVLMAEIFHAIHKDSLEPDEEPHAYLFRAVPRAWVIFQGYFQRWIETDPSKQQEKQSPFPTPEKDSSSFSSGQQTASSPSEEAHKLQLPHIFDSEQEKLMAALNSTAVQYLCQIAGPNMGPKTCLRDIHDMIQVPVDSKRTLEPISAEVKSRWIQGREIPALACSVVYRLLETASKTSETDEAEGESREEAEDGKGGRKQQEDKVGILLEALEAAHFHRMVSHRAGQETRIQPVQTSEFGLVREDSDTEIGRTEKPPQGPQEASQWIA